MKKIIFAIILSLLTASIGFCQDQPLQLTIKSDKQVYEVGEEIIITIEIKNRGKRVYRRKGEIVDVFSDTEYHFRELGNLEFLELDESGNTTYRRLSFIRNDYFCKWTDLVIEPGKSYVQTISLNNPPVIEDFRKSGLIFGKLVYGQHRLFAKFDNATSNTITIEVVGKKLEYLKQEYDRLIKFIVPPKGTLRESVEEFYGKPSRFVSKGTPCKCRTPQYKYKLPCPNCLRIIENKATLSIGYDNEGRVEWGSLSTADFTVGRDYPPTDEELILEYTGAVKSAESIFNHYQDKLDKASWNQDK